MKIFGIFIFSMITLSNLPCFAANDLEMGRGSYCPPFVNSWESGAVAKVGNFCSLATGVQIFTGGNHRPDWVTTYPFNVLWPQVAGHITGHPATKGDVIIGNDVWIGTGALILSGVTIGDGAVVGAHSVVSKNIPPYAIAVGNPAVVVKYRFDETTIQNLLQIAWWNWPDNEIEKAMPYLLSTDIGQFIHYCRSIEKL